MKGGGALVLYTGWSKKCSSVLCISLPHARCSRGDHGEGSDSLRIIATAPRDGHIVHDNPYEKEVESTAYYRRERRLLIKSRSESRL